MMAFQLGSDCMYIVRSECQRIRAKLNYADKTSLEDFTKLVMQELERLEYNWLTHPSVNEIIESYWHRHVSHVG